MWLNTIHSQNAEIVQILIDENILPPNNSYKACYKESLKYHHIDIAGYIEDFLSDENLSADLSLFRTSLQFFNFVKMTM